MEKKPTMFRGTSYTHCHKSAASYHVVIPKCKDVGEMTNDNPVNVREKERQYLLDVIMCLRYLARQEIALQGNEKSDNFAQLMMPKGKA